jgi:mannitol/fructose-specific phosphotransferase system IIA component (Ntr-type)
MKLLRQELADRSILLDLKAEDAETIYHHVMHLLVVRGVLAADDLAQAEAALLRREREASFAIGRSTAVPHIRLEVFNRTAVVFVRLARSIDLGAPDGLRTRFFFVLVGPRGNEAEHLATLMHIARLTSDDHFRFEAELARTEQDLLAAIDRFIVRTTPERRQQTESRPDALVYSGRLFGGLIGDVRRRLPAYLSDFRDGLNRKCAASVLFLLLACLAPAISFGGVMSVETDGHIGAVEMIVASAVCGTIYALCAGQPLIILGGTGPLLVFTIILYRLCRDMSLPFLPTYAWVGLWTAAFVLVLAATDASFLMRYFTRFTDEIFSALISLIFIVEAIKALVGFFRNPEISNATALLSVILALGTYYVAMVLSRFRTSRYLRAPVREFLADFGPTIAIASMTLVDLWLHDVVSTKLPIPDRLETTSGRPWLVDPMEAPRWVWYASAGPALLVTVLIFLDQNITARLVQSRDNNLKKGTTYHLDLAIVGGLVGLCSLFGLPWLVAATVRSLNHLRSLATVEQTTNAAGDKRDRIVYVRENRLTGLSIHLLVGLSLLLLPLLKVIPMAVLYGLFLYMGVVSMKGNQFFERLALWPMDPECYPATHYLRRVPLRTIHLFTLLQLLGLTALWVVKVSPLAILFPLFIALGVPIRMLVGRVFAVEHVAALDAEETIEVEEAQWV